MARDTRRPVPNRMLAGPPAPPASATSKIGHVSTDRTTASVPQPAAQGPGDSRTQLFTYLTKAPTDGQAAILYNGDRMWAKVTLTLQTAGPVAIGQQSSLLPVLGGQGILLTTDLPYEVIVAKGTRLYIAANGINRVATKIEPFPWLENITGLAGRIASK